MNAPCKHPQVRIVAREEDTEFVECQVCGEVFDAIEFDDMLREEEPDPVEGDEATPQPRRTKSKA